MNEWINKFNFVSKLKDNSQSRNGLSDKQYGTLSNRSASISSIKSSNGFNFIIKHDTSSQKSKSKSNSAPSSPNLNKSNQKSNTKISATSKIRSSISTSSNMKNINNGTESKKTIKKLAFSDDEIINDKPTKKSSKSRKSNDSEKESEPLNDSLNDSNETNDQRRMQINIIVNLLNRLLKLIQIWFVRHLGFTLLSRVRAINEIIFFSIKF